MSEEQVRGVADAIASQDYYGITAFDGAEGERLAHDLTAGFPP